jgi:hypothetical protein
MKQFYFFYCLKCLTQIHSFAKFKTFPLVILESNFRSIYMARDVYLNLKCVFSA